MTSPTTEAQRTAPAQPGPRVDDGDAGGDRGAHRDVGLGLVRLVGGEQAVAEVGVALGQAGAGRDVGQRDVADQAYVARRRSEPLQGARPGLLHHDRAARVVGVDLGAAGRSDDALGGGARHDGQVGPDRVDLVEGPVTKGAAVVPGAAGRVADQRCRQRCTAA